MEIEQRIDNSRLFLHPATAGTEQSFSVQAIGLLMSCGTSLAVTASDADT